MKILITGISGFLGFHLGNKLSKSHKISGLYNININNNLDKLIFTYSKLEEIIVVPDVIIMCHAAVVSGNIKISNEILNKVNVQFTDEILKKFPDSKCIYISSVSVFGRQENKINERILASPETDYGVSKLRAEQLILKNKSNKVIRFSSLYGKGMKQNTLIPNYSNQAIQNNQIEVWGNGSRFQNYIHIDDAVALIEKVIELNEVIDFPILGVDTTEYSNLQVAEIISEKTNSKITFVNDDYSTSYFYDNVISQKKLNWQPKIKLEEGLIDYLEWKEKQS